MTGGGGDCCATGGGGESLPGGGGDTSHLHASEKAPKPNQDVMLAQGGLYSLSLSDTYVRAM